MVFRIWFGIKPATAEVLSELFDAGEKGVRQSRAAGGRTRSVGDMRVRISELRSIMEAEAIDTDHGVYVLTPEGRAECCEAIQAFLDDLRQPMGTSCGGKAKLAA